MNSNVSTKCAYTKKMKTVGNFFVGVHEFHGLCEIFILLITGILTVRLTIHDAVIVYIALLSFLELCSYNYRIFTADYQNFNIYQTKCQVNHLDLASRKNLTFLL